MQVIKADLALCEGYANCVIAAPDRFDLDDEGMVVLLAADVPDDKVAAVEAAVRSCPVSALRLERA